MNLHEAEVLRGVNAAMELVLLGSFSDALDALRAIEAGVGNPLAELIANQVLVVERFAASLTSKEAAFATVQLSMLELEDTQHELRREIAERTRVQARVEETSRELRVNEARYRELVENMSDGVVVYRPIDDGRDFVFHDLNRSSARIERVEREATVGRRLLEVFPSAEAFGLVDVLRRVAATGEPEQLPARFYRDARISGWRENYVYRLPSGELVAVYRDVTAEKEAELALRVALKTTEKIIAAAPFALVLVSTDQVILRANEVAAGILGTTPEELVGREWSQFIVPGPAQVRFSSAVMSRIPSVETTAVRATGEKLTILRSVIPIELNAEDVLIEAFVDLTERKQIEAELGQARKLEAVGQLAAGIAHEINTPAQFVGDSLHFVKTSYNDLYALIGAYRAALDQLGIDGREEVAAAVREAEEAADLEYLAERMPGSFDRCFDGITRISAIVGAMKEFAHPGHSETSSADLNQAIKNTLVIASNEYKYVANVETELGDLPPVECHLGDLNQVFLNLIVNAAHAIAEVVGSSGKKGRITIRTAAERDHVRIEFADTGCGIPEEIRDRIYDPFFTTKPVGKGSGQGLAIARSIVVDKHKGSLACASELGMGTTFTVRIPIGDGASHPDDVR
jgi:PAS domain S-box-containing protein